jgi:hypothetical protein
MFTRCCLPRLVVPTICAAIAFSNLSGAQPRLKPIPHHGQSGGQKSAPGSPWTPLTQQPTFLVEGAGNPILLTDGTVLVQDAGAQDWWKLTPDQHGSYINGTWSEVASLPSNYSPLYHSSAVLPDGRLIIEGGEYNFFTPAWTNLGAIYDPLANTWTPISPPAGWSSIGDAQSVVLANGTFMQANCCNTEAALLNASTLTWTATGSNKFDPNDEEGWNLLPNGEVLAVDAYVPIAPFPFIPMGTNSELYDPSTGSWHSAGSTIVQLWDSQEACGSPNPSFELGPGVLRPDGTVFYMGSDTCPGAPGNTAIYNSVNGTWTPGPQFPDGLDISDGPAALEPNGKVIMMTSPGFGNTPSIFFEWDGQSLTQIPGTPNAPNDVSFIGNMLVLPTGQILLTDFSDDVEIYTPSPGYRPDWAPEIAGGSRVLRLGSTYQISGRRFNGMSQGASYGDDVQAATNYPLVRITMKSTGHVFYCRTHDHSSMAVASDAEVSTFFDLPATMERGEGKLEVVANGIPSVAREVSVF